MPSVPLIPRLWLCGHIHESRGIVTKHFQSNEEGDSDSTIVINASNANSGRANRIVSGAVVVEVERHSSKIDGYQSAESTLQSRKLVDIDDYLVSPPTNGDLNAAGMDGMEVNDYISRPGVRRRKGIPSARQKMKQVRSTLVQQKESA